MLTGTQNKIQDGWRDKLKEYPEIMADMFKVMTMLPPNKRQRINWTSGLKAKTGHEILTEEEMGKQMRITRKNQQVKQEIKINIEKYTGTMKTS